MDMDSKLDISVGCLRGHCKQCRAMSERQAFKQVESTKTTEEIGSDELHAE